MSEYILLILRALTVQQVELSHNMYFSMSIIIFRVTILNRHLPNETIALLTKQTFFYNTLYFVLNDDKSIGDIIEKSNRLRNQKSY